MYMEKEFVDQIETLWMTGEEEMHTEEEIEQAEVEEFYKHKDDDKV